MAKFGLKFFVIALPSSVLWYAIAFHTTPIALMDTPIQRFYFSLNCIGVAAFFCLILGVEAVAHDRLFSPAIDPLAGIESRRLKVNKQYLQNTLEQTVLFLIAVLCFSTTCQNGEDMRLVLASTFVWILSRFIFWISYHRNSLNRVYGLTGMILTIVLLGYSVFSFIFNTFGSAAAMIGGSVFTLIEAILFYRSWKDGQKKI